MNADNMLNVEDRQPGDMVWPEAGSVEERLQRLEFLEMIADGSELKMNDIPWREAYVRLVAIIDRKPFDMLQAHFKDFLRG